MDYRTVLRAKGIKRIPSYDKLRTSKASPGEGDMELIGGRWLPVVYVETVATKRLTKRNRPPRLRSVA